LPAQKSAPVHDFHCGETKNDQAGLNTWSLNASKEVTLLEIGYERRLKFMKLLKWVRFTWDLTKLPLQDVGLPQHYQIAAATAGDEKSLRKVFSSSFLLDPTWNSAIGVVMQTIQSRLDAAFASDKYTCLALRHGPRIIGAVLLGLNENVEDQLSLGPSILTEYRNRGFGTRLLQSSLIWLREAGLTRASGMALDYAPVAKFLYPKFDGVITQAEPAALVAAA
jgi:hypothetical protein